MGDCSALRAMAEAGRALNGLDSGDDVFGLAWGMPSNRDLQSESTGRPSILE